MRYYAAAAMVVGVLLPAMKACEIVIFPFIVVGGSDTIIPSPLVSLILRGNSMEHCEYLPSM